MDVSGSELNADAPEFSPLSTELHPDAPPFEPASEAVAAGPMQPQIQQIVPQHDVAMTAVGGQPVKQALDRDGLQLKEEAVMNGAEEQPVQHVVDKQSEHIGLLLQEHAATTEQPDEHAEDNQNGHSGLELLEDVRQPVKHAEATNDVFLHTEDKENLPYEQAEKEALGDEAAEGKESGSQVPPFASAASGGEAAPLADSSPASAYGTPLGTEDLHWENSIAHAAAPSLAPIQAPAAEEAVEHSSVEEEPAAPGGAAADAAAAVTMPALSNGKASEEEPEVAPVAGKASPVLVSVPLHLCSGIQTLAPVAVRRSLDCAVSAFVEATAMLAAFTHFSFSRR